MGFRTVSVLLATMMPALALAEPVGEWWTGYGQGTFEYGVQNDSAGSDAIYITCNDDRTVATMSVGGNSIPSETSVLVTIGAHEFELSSDDEGNVATASRSDSDNFEAFWHAMRAGQSMRVRLATGQSTAFTLKGAAKALPKQPCLTDFAR